MSLARAFSTSGLTKPKSVTLALFAHRFIIITKLFSATDENHNNDQNIYSEPCSLART